MEQQNFRSASGPAKQSVTMHSSAKFASARRCPPRLQSRPCRPMNLADRLYTASVYGRRPSKGRLIRGTEYFARSYSRCAAKRRDRRPLARRARGSRNGSGTAASECLSATAQAFAARVRALALPSVCRQPRWFQAWPRMQTNLGRYSVPPAGGKTNFMNSFLAITRL
jgi:hypothetical protein